MEAVNFGVCDELSIVVIFSHGLQFCVEIRKWPPSFIWSRDIVLLTDFPLQPSQWPETVSLLLKNDVQWDEHW